MRILRRSTPMIEGKQIWPPVKGWEVWIKAAPDNFFKLKPEVFQLDINSSNYIRKIQQDVNRQVAYTTDEELYGKPDRWALPTDRGDCEDYALKKRQLLKLWHLPAGALRIATCWTEGDEYHAVLTVETDRGTYVLDNRYRTVQRWADLPYRWHARVVPGGWWWRTIDPPSQDKENRQES